MRAITRNAFDFHSFRDLAARLTSVLLCVGVMPAVGCETDSKTQSEPAGAREQAAQQEPSAKDNALAERVEEALEQHDALSDLEAEARDGVVRLSGRVDNAAQRMDAIRTAWGVPDVRRVEDHMRIKRVPDEVLERRVAQALTMEPATALDTRVQVLGGVVTLRGPVRDAATKQLVHDIAASVDGVRRVIDRTMPRQLHVRVLNEEQLNALRTQLEKRREAGGAVEDELRMTPAEQQRVPDEVPFGSVLLQLGKGSGRLFVFREQADCDAIPSDLDRAGDALVMSAALQPRGGSWEGPTRTTQVRRWEPLPGAGEAIEEDALSADFVVERIDDERAEGTLHIRSLQPGSAFRLDAEVAAQVCGPPAE